MNIVYEVKKTTPKEFNELAKSVGWKERKEDNLQLALDHTLFMVCAYDENKIIGMGRIIGDMAIVLHLHSLVIRPEYQSKGIGTKIMNMMLDYVYEIKVNVPEVKVFLGCVKELEGYYERFGFIKRSATADLGESMILSKNKIL